MGGFLKNLAGGKASRKKKVAPGAPQRYRSGPQPTQIESVVVVCSPAHIIFHASIAARMFSALPSCAHHFRCADNTR